MSDVESYYKTKSKIRNVAFIIQNLKKKWKKFKWILKNQ